jgi:hypothetical protein
LNTSSSPRFLGRRWLAAASALFAVTTVTALAVILAHPLSPTRWWRAT